MNQNSPLWTPSQEQIADSVLRHFADQTENVTGRKFDTYGKLHQWSCEGGGEFWGLLWDYCGVVGDKGERIVANEDRMPGADYFPDARMSFAENLLRFEGPEDAIVFRAEDKAESRVSRDELRQMVSRLQQAFADAGLQKGDRVAGMMPNMPQTIAAMLAANSIGAIWSSCSPDFGVRGVLDRFSQIDPKIFIACDGYWYNGKEIDISDKLSEIIPSLNCQINVIVPLLGKARGTVETIPGTTVLDDFLAPFAPKAPEFVRLGFSHPLYILFSSGTTGIPKCIVHSQGGALLQHLKEQQLHLGLREGEKLFYFTTCGWMMWNWLVTGLATGATLMLFDGSPFAPDEKTIFDYAEQEGFHVLGTSAKYIDAIRNAGLEPAKTHDLSALRVICSTGSPLAPENFAFVYSHIKSDVHLASMSGGTDIMACFVAGIPWHPVYSGEIQGAVLGMATEVWDDGGKPLQSGKGELVCTHAFPSMPIEFWNDPGNAKYHDAYFSRFDNIWCHGDYAEWSDTGGMIIHGRSDATLNPGGVRIGTAEIYNQVEQLPEVEEALCIGQDWDNDVRVVLFVKLAAGVKLDEALQTLIRQKIRTGASPRHVPAKIIPVADIPRTKSGKITELAVRDIVHGRKVKNQEALANPEALENFVNLEELRS